MNELITTGRAPVTAIGRQLYHLIPAVYRDRDNTSPQDLGDFGKYLDACGELLDLVRGTLEQRLADSFPDNPPGARDRAAQPWLLPYFAQLVDVRLVSPDPAGQRDEVALAVAWRQRKGTVAGIEEIAESVGRIEVEVQEGWRRVATTPRVGIPLIPAASLGVDPSRPTPNGGRELKYDPRRRIDAARHPGLPAVTVDFRSNSGAVLTTAANPAAHVTNFGEGPQPWRQVNPHGIPCAPGSYQNVSRRTADARSPDGSRGLVNPRRILLFAPPPRGFFGDIKTVPKPATKLSGEMLEGAFVDTMVTVDAPGSVIEGCAIRLLAVTTAEGNTATPTVRIRNSLIENIQADGFVEMEYCTVLGNAEFQKLHASECIFAGTLTANVDDGCIRFSRVPAATEQEEPTLVRPFGVGTNTASPALFQDFLFCENNSTRLVRRPAVFGEPGAGVLHATTHASVRLGAEDGGEMGAYHAQAYALCMQAILEKLDDFVPVGMSAILIADPMLHQTPHAEVGGEVHT